MVEDHRVLLAALQTRDPKRVMPLLERHIAISIPPQGPKRKAR
jgi:DNA-binding GntR family transcriptional regulator